jgi:hypothetical protein
MVNNSINFASTRVVQPEPKRQLREKKSSSFLFIFGLTCREMSVANAGVNTLEMSLHSRGEGSARFCNWILGWGPLAVQCGSEQTKSAAAFSRRKGNPLKLSKKNTHLGRITWPQS